MNVKRQRLVEYERNILFTFLLQWSDFDFNWPGNVDKRILFHIQLLENFIINVVAEQSYISALKFMEYFVQILPRVTIYSNHCVTFTAAYRSFHKLQKFCVNMTVR